MTVMGSVVMSKDLLCMFANHVLEAAKRLGFDVEIRCKIFLRNPLHQFGMFCNKIDKPFSWGKLHQLALPFILQDHGCRDHEPAKLLHLF